MSNENEIIEMLELDDPLMFLPTTIRIKRGDGVPTTDDLQDGELGFSRARKTLYIKDGTYTGTKVPQEHRLEGKDYSGIIPIGTVTGGGSGGGSVEIELDTTVSQPGMVPDAAAVRQIIGYLDNLETENKNNLVAAINEAYAKTSTIDVDDSLTQVGQAADAATVGEKIQEIWDKINYVKFSIISFNINNAGSISNENGNPVKNPTFSWSFSKKPSSLKIEGINKTDFPLEKSGSYTYENTSFTKYQTFKLVATDETGEVYSKTVSISFYNAYYYGWVAEPAEYNDNFIKEVLKNEPGSGYTKSSSFISKFTQKSGSKEDNRFVYYCYPVDNKTYTFIQNGAFPFPMSPIQDINGKEIIINHENDYGWVSQYRVLRSSNSGLGESSITVTRS